MSERKLFFMSARWQPTFPPQRLPRQDILEMYVRAAIQLLEVRRLDCGPWYASVPGLAGPWGVGRTEKRARLDFEEVLCDWITLKERDGDCDFPILNGIGINPKRP